MTLRPIPQGTSHESARFCKTVTLGDDCESRKCFTRQWTLARVESYAEVVQSAIPLMKNVVLIGGGHAHALVMRSWAMEPTAGVRVTVINPAPTAPYTGMLPGFVAGHYTRDELDIDLVKLGRFADTRVVIGAATGIDRDNKTVTVDGRPPIPYDICSINIGITSELRTLPGFMQHAVPAKPLGTFANRWTDFVASRAGVVTEPRVVVIGGGVGGSELAMAMAFRLREEGHRPQVTVVDRSNILTEVGDTAEQELRAGMQGLGIEVREHVAVESVAADHVTVLAEGRAETVPADLIVGCLLYTSPSPRDRG